MIGEYNPPIIVNTHAINFFYVYNHQTSRYQLSEVEFINCNKNGFQVTMSNQNLMLLVHQFESISKEMMVKYGLVDSIAIANSIIERIERGNNPDEFPEFKNYVDSFVNGVKSYLEIYLHPLTLVTSIPNIISQEIVGRIVDDEKHIKNINKLSEFVYSGTLVFKQVIYRSHLRYLLLTFAKLKEVSDTGRCCTFRFDSCGISHISPI